MLKHLLVCIGVYRYTGDTIPVTLTNFCPPIMSLTAVTTSMHENSVVAEPQLVQVESNARTYARKFPAQFQKGEGLMLYDVEGTLDMFTPRFLLTLPLGHNHPILRQAILDYVESGLPQQCLDLATTAKAEFVTELWHWLPEKLRPDAKIQFTSPAGTDAVEAAMKLVRIATGRSTIIAFDGGYHGHTVGSLAAMGNIDTKSQLKTGVLGDIAFFPYPHPDYSPFGLESADQTAQVSAKYLESRLADPDSGITKPAGIIVECIQGEGGVVPAPREWLKALRKIATKFDIPLIFDEVQSGFARTGTGFAFEYAEGVVPDVIVMSKAVGGGMPLACVVYHKRLDIWQPGSHAGTFRGNQIALFTGSQVLRYMRINNLAAHAADVGELFKARFLGYAEENRVRDRVLSVRGRGLMMGIQLVSPDGSRKEDGDLALRVQRTLFDKHRFIIERGGRFGSVLRVLPPLTITREEIVRCAETLVKGITESL
uniref:Putative aminotransferase Amo1 n=1 Tax=Omphalotus olearius TaxID=72120 RepID=Q2VIS5_OMPOL|nr:putative aminotransferase Amo1 [Omphalotus olearius]